MDKSDYIFLSDSEIEKVVFHAEGTTPPSSSIPNPTGKLLMLSCAWRPSGSGPWFSDGTYAYQSISSRPSLSVSCTLSEIKFQTFYSGDIDYRIVGVPVYD